jgi:hypothetical protein
VLPQQWPHSGGKPLTGIVVGFEASNEPTKTDAWRKCYGAKNGKAACIRIKLDEVTP